MRTHICLARIAFGMMLLLHAGHAIVSFTCAPPEKLVVSNIVGMGALNAIWFALGIWVLWRLTRPSFAMWALVLASVSLVGSLIAIGALLISEVSRCPGVALAYAIVYCTWTIVTLGILAGLPTTSASTKQ